MPGIRTLLAQLHAEVDVLEASVEPTWEALVQPLERIVDRLSRAWGTVSHLKAVKDSEDLRKARMRLSWIGGQGAVWERPCVFCFSAAAGFAPATDDIFTDTEDGPLNSVQAVEEVQPERVKLSLRLSQVGHCVARAAILQRVACRASCIAYNLLVRRQAW